jgi:hypothetical protein
VKKAFEWEDDVRGKPDFRSDKETETMKRILMGVALCLTLAQPVQAQGPIWGVFHSIHTKVSDGGS